MAQLHKSVGKNGSNQADDVRTVQSLLNRVPLDRGGPSPALAVDGLCWSKTLAAIHRFQKTGCGFQWPDELIQPNRRTWNELARYDAPPAPPPVDEPKCCAHAAHVVSPYAGDGVSKGFFVGKYAPVPLDAYQRTVARSVFGDSLDLDAILVLYRKPPGGKGLCVVGPLPGQNTLLLCCSARELLIHELAHAWQSQHHGMPGMYVWNSLKSQQMKGEDKTVSVYAYVPGKPFGEYAAEQIAEQVEAGETAIVDHVRSRFRRFKDAANAMSLATPRVQSWYEEKVKRAPRTY